MLMVIPNEGKAWWSSVATGQVPGDDIEVQLFSNDYTPVNGSTAGSFTPATFTGAGVWTIAIADWNMPAIIANEAITDAVPAPEWTHGVGPSQMVYGWFAVEASTGLCVMAQRFDAPANMNPGSIMSLDPFEIRLKTYA